MAKEDDVPQVDIPYYGRLSHPISPIPAQKFVSGAAGISATGEALGAIGKLVEGGTKFAEHLADLGQTKIAEDTNQPLVRQRVAEVAGVRDAIYGGRTTATASPTDQSIPGGVQQPGTGAATTQGGEDVPLDQNAQGAVRSISDMTELKRSGKISNTQYLGNLDKINSDIRARMPLAMRHSYDSKVAQVTGVAHTANAYIASATADINDAVSRAQGAQDKIATRILNNLELGPDMMHYYTRFMSGQDPGGLQALSAIARYSYQKADRANQIQELQLKSAQGESTTREAKQVMSRDAEQAVNNEVVKIAQQFGGDEAIKTPEGMRQWITNLAPAQADALAAAVDASMNGITNGLRQQWTSPTDRYGGQSLLQHYGTDFDTAMQVVKPNFAFHQMLKDSLVNKDTSPVYSATRTVQRIQSAAQRDLLESPTLSPQMSLAHAVAQSLGNNAAAFLTTTNFPGLNDALQEHRKEKEFQAIIGAPGRSAFGDAQDTTRRMRGQGYSDDQITPVIDTYAHRTPEILTDPKTPLSVKHNFVQYYYGPGNKGLIAAAGQNGFKYYDQMFDPRVTKAVKGQLSSDDWSTYKNSAQSFFASEIAVPLSKELANMPAYSNLRITFNDDPKAEAPFDYDEGKQKGMLNKTALLAPPFQAEITKLNNAYSRIKVIAEADGQDPKAYMYSVFTNLGTGNPVDKMIADAIKNTKITKPKPISTSTEE